MAKKTININLTGEAIFKVFDVAERTVKSMAHITGYTLLFLLSAGAIGFLVKKPVKKDYGLKVALANLKSKSKASPKADKPEPKGNEANTRSDAPSDPVKDPDHLDFLD